MSSDHTSPSFVGRSYWWGSLPPPDFPEKPWQCGGVYGSVPAPGTLSFSIARCPLSDVVCGCNKSACWLRAGGDYKNVSWRHDAGKWVLTLN